MATNQSNSKLQRFEDAMKAVYGPFDGLTTERAVSWMPPSRPGAGGHRGRYLWTDAFGVLNFITLSRESKSKTANNNNSAPLLYLQLAKRLAQTVHDVLGYTRDGSTRLPGATEEYPLNGGLRIGKPNEDGPDGADGDGQYHHYLTLWMFALNRLAVATGEGSWNELAVQLAKAVHPKFVGPRKGGGEVTMVWKLSTDMRRVLVPSKGHLDDVTGLVVFCILQETAQHRYHQPPGLLQPEINQYEAMIAQSRPFQSSDDPLDLGMSLWISHFERDAPWSRELAKNGLDVARRGVVPSAVREVVGGAGRRRRFAFRDFGACLGVKCYCDGDAGRDDGDGGGDDAALVRGVDGVAEAWGPFLVDVGPDLKAITLVMSAAALVPSVFRAGCLDA